MLGGGAAPEGNHLFIGLHHPPGADTTRCKRDANFQCWNACSTCHDGLLAVVTSASQGAVLSGAVPPETRHHSQVVVVSVEYSSRTLPRCWQLCRKCTIPALRRAGRGMPSLPVFFQHARLQPLRDEPQTWFVIDPLLQHPEHPLVINGVEAALHSCFYTRAVSPTWPGVPPISSRLFGPPLGTVALAAWQEVFVEDRAQNQCYCSLQELLFERWETERTALAVPLRSPSPSHPLCPVCSSLDPLTEVSDVREDVPTRGGGGHPIHTTCCLLPEVLPATPEEWCIAHPTAMAKPVPLVTLRLVRYALQGGWHCVPILRVRPMFPVQASSLCHPLPPVDGSPVLRVLRGDPTSHGPSTALRVVGWVCLSPGVPGISHVLSASLSACQALRTPTDPPASRPTDAFVWASGA